MVFWADAGDRSAGSKGPCVRSVRLQADRHGPAKAGHYVQVETAGAIFGGFNNGSMPGTG
jgi:hypothetical protein